MGARRQLNLNPENKYIIPSPHKSPSPAAYSKPSDNINFRRKSAMISPSEKKFFAIENMHRVKAAVPVQYTAQDGVSQPSNNLNAAARGSSLSGHYGGSDTSAYRQVKIGKSKRSDFTLENVADKADFSYDYDKMGSLK